MVTFVIGRHGPAWAMVHATFKLKFRLGRGCKMQVLARCIWKALHSTQATQPRQKV